MTSHESSTYVSRMNTTSCVHIRARPLPTTTLLRHRAFAAAALTSASCAARSASRDTSSASLTP